MAEKKCKKCSYYCPKCPNHRLPMQKHMLFPTNTNEASICFALDSIIFRLKQVIAVKHLF